MEASVVKSKVIIILGPTAVGKTRLSIDLAKHLNTEIINADVMQMYKGLNIATNKLLPHEMEGIKHHLFDYLDPQQLITVRTFRDRARTIIDELNRNNKIPIIVGGTNYYITSVLFPSLIDDYIDDSNDVNTTISHSRKWLDMEIKSPEKLHDELKKIDPLMANKLHPSDTRKIRRSLEIFDESGLPHSKIIEQQKEFYNIPIYNVFGIFLNAPKDILHSRIDSRLDKMMSDGILSEVFDFWNQYKGFNPYGYLGINDTNYQTDNVKFSQGIWQAIGFKEFSPLFTKYTKIEDIPSNELEVCVDALRVNTKQYAKYQISFIKKKFIDISLPIMQLDTTNLDLYIQNILEPSKDFIQLLIDGRDPPPETVQPLITEDDDDVIWEHYKCEQCDRLFVGSQQYHEHLNSNKHKKMRKKLRNKSKYEEYIKHKLAKVNIDDCVHTTDTVSINDNGSDDSDLPDALKARHQTDTDNNHETQQVSHDEDNKGEIDPKLDRQ